jgi:hypothetical protein
VHGSVNDDVDVEPSNVITDTQLTTRERANEVIRSGHISLDPKLVVFTVTVTYEPQVVRLFPNTSCSCPAKSDCYHVLAASMTIGMHCEEPKTPFNLTQLRRNKSKHLDKTSGRKHPRTDDVDMVPAGDDDGCTAAGFVGTIALHVTQPSVSSESIANSDNDGLPDISLPTIDTNICYACNQEEPPARKARSIKVFQWVGCNKCACWYHTSCIGIKSIAIHFVCDFYC